MPRMIACCAALLLASAAVHALAQNVRTGPAAFGDWRGDAPGVARRITPADMPEPYASASASRAPSVIRRPKSVLPKVPPGFRVGLFASGLDTPRVVRVAPDGDVFLAESGAGRVRVYRSAAPGAEPQSSVFAEGLSYPFGIAFWPPGPDPVFVYVAETGHVVRFLYKNGATKAGRPEIVVPRLPEGGHWTRDIAFSPDGGRMFVSVGSASNVGSGMSARPPAGWESSQPPGAAWGDERDRADVLAFDPDGKDGRVFATGLRNCSGLAVQPGTGALWCAVNERDGLGDNLGARLRDLGAGGGVLWLALVLYRRARGPPPQGPPPRPREPRRRSRRADPAALRSSRDRVLRFRPVSPGVSRRCVRRAARLLEPRAAHGLQGDPPNVPRRPADGRVRGLPDRVRREQFERVGAGPWTLQ